MIRYLIARKQFTALDIYIAMSVGFLAATNHFLGSVLLGVIGGGIISSQLQRLFSKKEGA